MVGGFQGVSRDFSIFHLPEKCCLHGEMNIYSVFFLWDMIHFAYCALVKRDSREPP